MYVFMYVGWCVSHISERGEVYVCVGSKGLCG